MDAENRYQPGLRIRRSALGTGHVDDAEAGKTAFGEAFQRYIPEGAWGAARAGPQLDPAPRSLVTIALLGAPGRFQGLEPRVRAARSTGAAPDQVAESPLHAAVCAGAPAAHRAFASARRALEAGGSDGQRP